MKPKHITIFRRGGRAFTKTKAEEVDCGFAADA